MFQPITPDNLQYNKRYKIIGLHDYSGIYKRTITLENQYLEFIKVRNLSCKNECYLHRRYFISERLFYEFVSQKERIQSDMEHRAVNKIIRRVLGDEYFNW